MPHIVVIVERVHQVAQLFTISAKPVPGAPIVYLTRTADADYRIYVDSATISAQQAAAMIVSDPEEPERSQRLVYRSAGIFFALTLFASEAGKIFGRDGIDWMKAYGVYLVGSLIMTTAVLRAGAARRAEETLRV